MPPPSATSPATIPEQLDDLALLTLTLGPGCPRAHVAAHLLARFDGVHGLGRASAVELERARLRRDEAERLCAALELGRRTLAPPPRRGTALDSVAAVAGLFDGGLRGRAHEELHVLGLDARLRLQTHALVAVGGLAEVAILPRDLFRPLLRDGAWGCIVVHNHPSGDPRPSDADRTLTRRLQQAAELLGIRFVDHVIVAARGVHSFAAEEKHA
jgi:DNA repair protein RadC